MKNLVKLEIVIISLSLILTISSCTSVKQIGKVNMISNRNINPKLEYKVISTYSGGSRKELRKSKAKTVEEAIDQTVRKVPGGEFLMNAKLYIVNKEYYAAEGDVWGVSKNVSFHGFSIGDKVTWKSYGKYKKGIISSLKNDKTCLIKTEENNTVEKKYETISKID